MEKIKVGVVDLNNYAESIIGARVEMVEVDSHAWCPVLEPVRNSQH